MTENNDIGHLMEEFMKILYGLYQIDILCIFRHKIKRHPNSDLE